MQYVKINSESSELYHFGVKGMRWGIITKKDSSIRRPSREKKNLKTSTFEKRELKAAKFERLASESKTQKQKDMYLKEADRARAGKLSRRQRQVLVGASIVAAYATYKLVDSGEAQRLIANGKAAVEGKKFEWKRNEMLADKNLTPDEVFSKVVSRINDDYGKPGTTNNCRRCTFSYIKARQGYDVIATKTLKGTGQTDINLYNITNRDDKIKGGAIGAFKSSITNTKFQDFILQRSSEDIHVKIDTGPLGSRLLIHDVNQKERGKNIASNLLSQLSKMPHGAAGEFEMHWNTGGGHSMAWEVFNGKPIIFDTQTRTMYDTQEALETITSRVKLASYSRLDNVDLDEKIIGRWMKNAK